MSNSYSRQDTPVTAAAPNIGDDNLGDTPPLQIQVDPDLLQYLGEDPESLKTKGILLHEVLLSRWSYILEEGLPADKRAELLGKYPPPSNFDSTSNQPGSAAFAPYTATKTR